MQLANGLKIFVRSDDGVTAVEYGFIAALVSVAFIAGAIALDGGIGGLFDKNAAKLTGVTV